MPVTETPWPNVMFAAVTGSQELASLMLPDAVPGKSVPGFWPMPKVL